MEASPRHAEDGYDTQEQYEEEMYPDDFESESDCEANDGGAEGNLDAEGDAMIDNEGDDDIAMDENLSRRIILQTTARSSAISDHPQRSDDMAMHMIASKQSSDERQTTVSAVKRLSDRVGDAPFVAAAASVVHEEEGEEEGEEEREGEGEVYNDAVRHEATRSAAICSSVLGHNVACGGNGGGERPGTHVEDYGDHARVAETRQPQHLGALDAAIAHHSQKTRLPAPVRNDARVAPSKPARSGYDGLERAEIIDYITMHEEESSLERSQLHSLPIVALRDDMVRIRKRIATRQKRQKLLLMSNFVFRLLEKLVSSVFVDVTGWANDVTDIMSAPEMQEQIVCVYDVTFGSGPSLFPLVIVIAISLLARMFSPGGGDSGGLGGGGGLGAMSMITRFASMLNMGGGQAPDHSDSGGSGIPMPV